ncbi:MAG: ester cyclase [Anaerolineaceae bacterium]|nr:ester cyclase [Anaerolineaceae bacterium]
MGKKENENAIRRFMTEIWSKGDMNTIDELIDPNFAFILAFTRTDTIEGFKRMVSINREAFQGLTYVPNDIVADDTKAACWWTMSSKHVGTWRNVPGSNKDVSIDGVTFFWFSPQGKLAKAVVENDVMGLMRQINGIKLLYES